MSNHCRDCNELKYIIKNGKCISCFDLVLKVVKEDDEVPSEMVNRAEELIEESDDFILNENYATHVVRIQSDKIVMDVEGTSVALMRKENGIEQLRWGQFDSIIENALDQLKSTSPS